MPKTKVPQNVKPEGYWRAIGAFSIDLALTIVAIVLLYVSIGNTLIYKAVDYAGDIAKMDAFMEGTALVNIKAPKSYGYLDFQDKEGEVPAYQKYIDRVWNYFTVLCADPNSGYDINPPMTSFDNEHDFVPFTGEKTVENIGKWVYDHYFTSNLWKAPVKEGTQDPDYSKAPIPAEDPTGREAKLKTAMYDVSTTTPKGTYVFTVSHILAQNKYAVLAKTERLHGWFAWMPWFAVAPVIFFFVIPVASRNGRTIGKRIVGTAVLGSDGYTAKKLNIVLHYFFPTIYWFILMLPYQGITFPLFVLLLLVEYMTLVMTHNHQSIHDKIAQTIVVNAKQSTWFASREDEEEYLKSHPNSYVAKLRRDEEWESNPRYAATTAAIAAQDAIVDSTTIGRARKEAEAISSFDEFERKSDEDYARRESEAKANSELQEEPEEELSEQEKQELADLAKMEGLSEEEAAAALEKEEPESEEDDFADKK